MQGSAADYLKSIQVSVLPAVDTIHHVLTTDTAAQALKVLRNHNVLSAPILDKEKNMYVGFIDMVDLVTFLVDITQEAELMGEGFLQLLEEGTRFATTPVTSISNFSSRNPFVPVRSDASLYAVIEVLAKHGVHRVPIVNNQNRVINIITQSAVIAFLAKNLKELGSVVNSTLADLHTGSKDAVTVNISSRTIDAFKAMSQHRISAVAVVDNEGILLANVSVRDIRAVSSDARIIQRMYLPVREFLVKMNEDKIDILNPGISCHSTDTYGAVLQKLGATRVHRIYIVDSRWHPTGVLSLSDALLPLVNAE